MKQIILNIEDSKFNFFLELINNFKFIQVDNQEKYKNIDDLEDIEDIEIYDKAKKSNDSYININEAFKIIENNRKSI